MQKHLVRKGFILGIIGLLLLVCIPQNVNADERPDLIVTDIIDKPGSQIYERYFYAAVKNIGSGPTHNIVDIQITVKKKLCGILPLNTIFTSTISHGLGGAFEPGETRDFLLIDQSALPNFGIYRIICWVNPEGIIEEQNYLNNRYHEDHFVFFGIWF